MPRTSFKLLFILLVIGASATRFSFADDADTRDWKLPAETARFKAAPGSVLATASCSICHSADYIATQPPLNRQQWTALVNKMKSKFGAPFMTNQVDELVDYLIKNYGHE